ncbi:MAG: PmbA protein [Thermoleophilaceae bacterium]|nr:PmbA protein [Thermoleophilaceae bacterium]
MTGRPDLEAAAGRAVDAAVAAGASDAEAYGQETTEREIRVYDGAVESLTDATSRGIGLRAFVGDRWGYAYGTDLSDGGLRELAAEAHAAASVADPDPHAGLPDELGAAEVGSLRSDELAGWGTDRKVELALAVERAARGHPDVSQVEQVVYADGDGAHALANSRGFSDSFETSAAWSYASAFAGEGTDLMTGLGLGMGRGPEELDPESIGAEAAARATALQGARQPSSRRCPVVFDTLVAASFLGFIGGMLSADAVQRGRSLFAGREGDEIATPELRLADDGTLPDGLASAPFDGEGSPRRRIPLIEDGRLLTFLFDTRTARKADRATTASAERSSYRGPPSVGTSNLVVEAGDAPLEELVRQAGDGLYVTDVVGLHSGVNPVSGTFSVGATGILIAGGELGEPVREITIASDLVSMLRSVRAVGAEARWVPFGGSVRAAPLLLGEMAVSGS